MKQMTRQWLRFGIIGAALGAITLLLLLPSAVFGLTATFGPLAKNTFKLGELVTFPAEIQIPQNEVAGISKVELDVQGPQPVKAELTTGPGAGQNLTNSLPKDNSQPPKPLGKLFVDVDQLQLQFLFVGYGYGYGYKGLSTASKLKYVIKYTPPVLKFPAPAALAPAINSPAKAFNMPNATTTSPTLEFVKQFDIPGVPGAPPGSKPLGLEMLPFSTQMLILVDGGTGNDDVLLRVDSTSGFLIFFQSLTNLKETQAVAADNNNTYVAYTDGTTRKVKSLSPGATGVAAFPANTPPVKGLFYDQANNRLLASTFGSDPGA
ncbi:MAG: hypothetical protein HY686_05610, partial [Chloroflexi bacterium]|nr:hypothetical protein [Chloroflexota bacterium]